MKKPDKGSNDLRGSFYNFYEEPMWSKCQKLLSILKSIGDERGVSVAEVSINWVISQPGVTCALTGATTPEKAIQNAKAADFELSAEELYIIEDNYIRLMS